ncbi:MAG TPA: ATP-binding protein [Acidimicrobiales bacterium]|nr:ATP-binding protein [Acidimicrobiales bacterium]
MTPSARTSESSMSDTVQFLRLHPTRDAGALSRAFVEPLVQQWKLGPLDYDAALITTELVTNAVLHAEFDVVVALRPIANGVRIEVTDQCPSVLPHAAPYNTGDLFALTLGLSGRGLRVVSELAARWGVDSTQKTKTVWAELITGQSGPSEPLLQLEYELVVRDGLTLRLLDLPTDVAIESGVQIEDVVRAIQLEHGPVPPDQGTVARIYQLLLSTAADRLAGRDAVLWASTENRPAFDLEVVTTMEAMQDLGELWRMLEDPSGLLEIEPPPAPERVVAFRHWLRDEALRQVGGEAPHPYGSA